MMVPMFLSVAFLLAAGAFLTVPVGVDRLFPVMGERPRYDEAQFWTSLLLCAFGIVCLALLIWLALTAGSL